MPTVLPDGTAVPQTPAELAAALIAAVEPTTTVTATDHVEVAGRSAYQVVLTPKDDATLVASATLTVDSETGVPLKVVVAAKGQADPAVSVGFTSVDFSAPASSVFDFTPPAGAEVTEVAAPDGAHDRAHAARDAGDAPVVVGSGWSTVVGTNVPAATGASASDEASSLLDQMTTAVDGGRVVETSLLSVYLGDDGRVWAGAVDAATLQAAVAGR